eukprot:CAMPEP_0177282880 /NCGR_PEP_ID=MMETSP0367-20130122/71698_1 /TAXON_ID=447022 ORGANISM="Scrippsiella hangoei-like, Strain SHHI-4" /NCGR_SAMPLE_ID=MMETSP0367 /ASSEMBLY_ACC=CAM_ASM_000362 /LENGTH=126 /DNA_ID=CAMNT_0018739835 /DNA_START=13 /DNA_END=390 /DNA_ORIENTATION=+
MYANIFRSALVLHVLSIFAFICTVMVCSFSALLLDRWFSDGNSVSTVMTTALGEDWLEQLANDTDTGVDALREQMISISKMSWHGIHLVHFFSGLAMVGIGGLVSMGFVWFPAVGTLGNRFIDGPV